MGRPATGSFYQDKKTGRFYLSFTVLGKKRSWPLPDETKKLDAERRKDFVFGLFLILKRNGAEHLADAICGRAAQATDEDLDGILETVGRLEKPKEEGGVQARPTVSSPFPTITTEPTFGQLASLWTSGELHRQYPDDIQDINHKDNILRLNKHILPCFVGGRKVGEIPLSQFTIDVANTICNGSHRRGTRKHVKQIVRYLLQRAVYPCQFIEQSPIPPGWVPKSAPTPKGAFLFPEECDLLLVCKRVHLVRRLCIGVGVHEGPRRSKILSLQWNQLEPSVGDPRKLKLTLPGKPNKPGASFLLNDGTAEALRRWRRICPSQKWVFPAEGIPRYRRKNRGKHMVWGDSAAGLREALGWAGIHRTSLTEPLEGHARLVAHDLRATYVTLARLRSEHDELIMRRTGHTQKNTLDRYDHAFGEMKELQAQGKTFELTPLCDAIPELAEMDPSEEWVSLQSEHNVGVSSDK